jgi:hypothetical protein
MLVCSTGRWNMRHATCDMRHAPLTAGTSTVAGCRRVYRCIVVYGRCHSQRIAPIFEQIEPRHHCHTCPVERIDTLPPAEDFVTPSQITTSFTSVVVVKERAVQLGQEIDELFELSSLSSLASRYDSNAEDFRSSYKRKSSEYELQLSCLTYASTAVTPNDG